ncbi:hypothetical protein N2152v2_010106 [Parachlorella kessleri]
MLPSPVIPVAIQAATQLKQLQLQALGISYNEGILMGPPIWRHFDHHTGMAPGLRGLRSLSVDIGVFSDDTPHLSALTHLHLTCQEGVFSPDDFDCRDMFDFLCSFPQL